MNEDWRSTYKRQQKYEETNVYRTAVKFYRKTDSEIIDALEKAPSKNALIREALRYYIEHKGEEK